MKLLYPLIFLLLSCSTEPETKDCAGIEGGSAYLDDCEQCVGGTTGNLANYLQDCSGECGGDAIEDCLGECNGLAVIDNCATCDADSLNDCVQDCLGDWGGDAVLSGCDNLCNSTQELDECDVCGGDGTSCIDLISPEAFIAYPVNNSIIDSLVTIKINALDNIGISEVAFFIDGNQVISDFEYPYEYNWNTCEYSNGNHSVFAKIYDLSNNLFQTDLNLYSLTASIDCEGVCGGNKIIDCNGDCDGLAIEDECGTCDYDSSNDCIEDCAGIMGGENVMCDGLCGDFVELWSTCYSIGGTTVLDLGNNSDVWGYIPEDIGKLIHLSSLYLDNNDLYGSIPESIGNLTDLIDLQLYHNDLTGNIPESIGNLVNLRELHIWDNDLTGDLPESFGNLVSLRYFRAGDNNLTGTLSEIVQLTSLDYLNLQHNQFTGQIPTEIGNLTNLTDLDLGSNQLTGEIPPEFGQLENLTQLDLGSNQLSGEIPQEVCDLMESINLGIYNITYNNPDLINTCE